MGLGAGRGLSWCAWLHHRQRLTAAFTLRPLVRTLFSQTGVWEKELIQKEREQIEKHWMPIIKENDQLRCQQQDAGKDKYYVLSMFPYPSGRLHMGHVRVYTLSDTMARFHRLAGRSVIHPMGWDAFGLPAENAAIERGEKPDQWTYENIASMRQQLDQLGCSFDWHREFATCDPAYYRWTQYLFLKMLEAGLVYQKEGEVNWDPVDMTVLADEQIDEAGRSWRSGAMAEKRYLKQWYIKTTAMAQSLYEGLEEVDQDLWGDIVQLQRHWIGQCDGTRLRWDVQSVAGEQYDPLHIYTSTPEAVYGVAFIAVSPQHRLNQPALYQENIHPDAKDIPLSLRARHPFTSDYLPIVVSSSLEFDDFNDTQLGIPSTDEAAQTVAEQLGIPCLEVLQGAEGEQQLIDSQDMNGLIRSEAFQAVLKKAKEAGVGGDLVSRRLRDWLISRQRYWGTPIPVVHCDHCQAVPVPHKDLPVVLPAIDRLTGRGPSPLTQQDDWVHTTCPRCGGAARRETDTMDTFVDSSWYFLRYLDPANTDRPFSKQLADRGMPVDLYIGGKEHAVMHLYYVPVCFSAVMHLYYVSVCFSAVMHLYYVSVCFSAVMHLYYVPVCFSAVMHLYYVPVCFSAVMHLYYVPVCFSAVMHLYYVPVCFSAVMHLYYVPVCFSAVMHLYYVPVCFSAVMHLYYVSVCFSAVMHLYYVSVCFSAVMHLYYVPVCFSAVMHLYYVPVCFSAVMHLYYVSVCFSAVMHLYYVSVCFSAVMHLYYVPVCFSAVMHLYYVPVCFSAVMHLYYVPVCFSAVMHLYYVPVCFSAVMHLYYVPVCFSAVMHLYYVPVCFSAVMHLYYVPVCFSAVMHLYYVPVCFSAVMHLYYVPVCFSAVMHLYYVPVCFSAVMHLYYVPVCFSAVMHLYYVPVCFSAVMHLYYVPVCFSAVMHLYYARFFSHFLHGEGLVKHREPFLNLLTQGMVMGQSYRVKGTGRYLTRHQVDLTGGN
ncbi:hypothetical protein ACOMHN_006368 [Nucella lapillus]